MADLLLDPAIRTWVFLPIVLITFLIGIVRHYVALLFTSKKKVEMQQVQDSQYLIRGRLLRENGRFLPKQSYLMRKHLFNDEENGYFKKAMTKTAPMQNPITDPSMMTDMLKGNLLNVLPMIVIGGWINWTFSGFVT
uniref:ER membrane protein complex subunit 3 n=1 Tax=Plectus sambesii TaxID=2011161 RepID=A0A914UML8_9BILA